MSEYVKVKDNKLIIDFNLLADRVKDLNVTLPEAELILREAFKDIAYALLQATEEHKVI